MKTLNVLVLLVITVLLSTVVLPVWLPAGWRPDLFALLVVFFSLRSAKRSALPLCWFIGLVRDVASSSPLGAHAALYLIAAFVIIHTRTETENRPAMSYVPPVALVAAATALLHAGRSAFASGGGLAAFEFGAVAACVAASALAAPVGAWALTRFGARPGIRRRYRFGGT